MPNPYEDDPVGQRLLNGLDPSHRLALSRFLSPCNAHGGIPEYWESVLGEPPQKVIDRFVAVQWLVPASLVACIEHMFTASSLHDLLKDRGLKVSGRKAVLIDRLVAADRDGMEKAVSHADLLEVAPSIRLIVEGFVAAAKAEHIGAMEQSLLLLREGRIEDAVSEMARYEARQVFPRGMGMNWTCSKIIKEFSGTVRIIFSDVPGRLSSRVSQEELPALRLATAMRYLWGQDKVLGLLEALPNSYKRFDARTAVYVYIGFAHVKGHLIRMRSDGITKVEIRGDESTSCPACRRLIGKTYPIDQMPEIPPSRCSCLGPSGCYLVGNYPDLAWQALRG